MRVDVVAVIVIAIVIAQVALQASMVEQ